MKESKATSSLQSGPAAVSTDKSLGETRDIFSFFHTPANVVQIHEGRQDLQEYDALIREDDSMKTTENPCFVVRDSSTAKLKE